MPAAATRGWHRERLGQKRGVQTWLLTGRRAFGGDDLAGITAAVLTTEPDWSLLPTDVPAFVRTLLSRCLEKDAARRLRDIVDVRIMLEDASTQSARR